MLIGPSLFSSEMLRAGTVYHPEKKKVQFLLAYCIKVTKLRYMVVYVICCRILSHHPRWRFILCGSRGESIITE